MPEQLEKIDVLVVDDSAINRKFAERILKDEYRVASAESGRQALEFLEIYEPKLILLDFRMPEMDGAETMAKIRENPAWEKIPVIILTADSAPETEKEFFEMGAADFIVKPFVPMTVKSRIGRMIELYGSGKNALDSLTGLHNRGYGEKAIDQLLAEGHKGALMIADMDNFKNVNDTYGHPMGDKVLKLLASALSSNVEDKDVLCRLGGDEFVAFFTDNADREELQAKVRHIMDAFSESLKEIGLESLTHISAGLALCPSDGKSFSNLYNNADKALYFVKKNGKNSCSFFRGETAAASGQRPGTDLDHIRQMLEGSMDGGRGLFKVPYEEFPNLYNYLSRCVKRKGQMVQTILFTIGSETQDYPDNSVCEEAMSTLEVAAAYSLRMVDVGSRYSSLQYIVILVDTNIENGRMVADRVVNQFYKIYAGTSVTLSYDIQTMVVNA